MSSLLSLIPVLGTLIDKVVPDKKSQDEAKLKILELAQAGELAELNSVLQRDLAQVELNKVEAQTDLFRGGWRPFVGWVCGSGLAIQFIIAPLLTWATMLAGHSTPFPELDMGTLLTLLFGMLGLGYMRTAEKIKGK